MERQRVRMAWDGVRRWVRLRRAECNALTAVLAQHPVLLPALTVALFWLVSSGAEVWAQATIDVPPLSEWLDTVSWYSLVPILRILGAAVFIGGLVNLGSTRHGSGVGMGLGMMGAGGALLLVPEMVDAIYTRTTVGATWATQPGGP